MERTFNLIKTRSLYGDMLLKSYIHDYFRRISVTHSGKSFQPESRHFMSLLYVCLIGDGPLPFQKD